MYIKFHVPSDGRGRGQKGGEGRAGKGKGKAGQAKKRGGKELSIW